MTAATVLTQPAMIRLRPRKPPAQRQYVPKPTDGGQRVTWSREISGHWTGASWGEGTWVPGRTVTRSGEIWSDGPYPRSSWVQPDDSLRGDMVLIRYATPREARWQGSITECHTAWRDAVRRAENLRRHGHVYAVLEGTERPWGYSYGTTPRERLSYHCDPCCELAAGKDVRPAHDGFSGYDFRHVLGIVLGERTDGNSPSLFCESCIWLQPAAAEVGELVNA